MKIQLPQQLLDKKIPLEERILIKKQADNEMMNPFDDFNPNNFEPLARNEEKELCYRKRIKPPKELPTFNIKPKEIMEGQMIGMYESKQDIYLIFAHKCNDMQKQIDLLEQKVGQLDKKLNNNVK